MLKQKAEQGSMQLQGEVLELDLENQLKAAFIHDQLEAVSKGVRGADVQHSVRTNTGHPCGMILWETKRTKNWSGGWTDKLKEDMRAAKAELAVLVTQILPDDVKHFGLVDGVWVCDYASALPLAVALRSGLVNAAIARLAETGKAWSTTFILPHRRHSFFPTWAASVFGGWKARIGPLWWSGGWELA